MADDPRVEALLEELLNSRGDAEEICHDFPELLPQVRAEWQRVREIQTEVGVLFPDPAGLDNAIPPAASVSQLPKIADHQVLDSWATVGWVSCTKPGTCASIGRSR